MGKNKKKAPNGQGGYGQKGTPTTNLSKATKARLEQVNKKLNDPKVQERLHKRGIQSWLEGERKLNENKRKHDEYWRKQSQIPIEQRLKDIYSKTKQTKGPAYNKK